MLILCIPVNNVSIMSEWVFLGLTSTKQRIKCPPQGHKPVPLVRFEQANPQSWVKHSTTKPLGSCSKEKKVWNFRRFIVGLPLGDTENTCYYIPCFSCSFVCLHIDVGHQDISDNVTEKYSIGICVYSFPWCRMLIPKMGLVARKPVFGVSDKVRFKPACSATETS